MNIADDLLARDHRAIEDRLDNLEKTPHRRNLIELTELVDRHLRMEREVLRPVHQEVRVDTATAAVDRRAAVRVELDALAEASTKRDVADVLPALRECIEEHIETQERTDMDVLEDELGVKTMNEVGMDLLHWQHAEDERVWQERNVPRPEAVDDLLDSSRRELYELAQQRDINGRSTMTKEELARALAGV